MRTELRSSHIRACEHEQGKDGMTLEFTDGRRYRYQNVLRETIDKLLESKSPGRHFREHIRGIYRGEKV